MSVETLVVTNLHTMRVIVPKKFWLNHKREFLQRNKVVLRITSLFWSGQCDTPTYQRNGLSSFMLTPKSLF